MFDLNVDFKEFLTLGKFGSLKHKSNCLLLLMSLGCPDEVSNYHRNLSDPIVLRYGNIQFALEKDCLKSITFTFSKNDKNLDLPRRVSFSNLMTQAERNLRSVKQLLQSQHISWRDSFPLEEQEDRDLQDLDDSCDQDLITILSTSSGVEMFFSGETKASILLTEVKATYS
jgi:hypothetical protein